MKLLHYDYNLLSDQIRVILKQFLKKPFRAFYFGSRVKGDRKDKGSDRSDIDLGIVAEYPIPIEVIGQIRDAIDEIPTLYTIDLVDFNRVNPKFRDVAMQHIEEIRIEEN